MAKILVAGRDFAGVDTACATIESMGHATVKALDGLDAFEKAISESPDLVILETEMDTFDGFETCTMLRGYPDIVDTLPIIFLAVTPVDPRRMEMVRATDQIPKNHLSVDLTDMLIRYLGEKAGA